MTIFRFSLLVAVVALVGFGLFVSQQRKAMTENFGIAKSAAQACGLPIDFVRYDKSASRHRSQISAGLLWFGCRDGEMPKIDCFDKAMKESGVIYEDTNIRGSCLVPPQNPPPSVERELVQ